MKNIIKKMMVLASLCIILTICISLVSSSADDMAYDASAFEIYEETADLNGDGNVDAWYIDTTGDGKFDRWFYDIDGDGIPDIYQYDYGGDCYPELTEIVFDEMTKTIGSVAKGDGKVNHWYADLNQDGYYNQKNYDSNGDGSADVYTYDRNGDGIFEEVNVDGDHLYIRGHDQESWNQWYIDTNHDGIYDTCRYDLNGDFKFSADCDLEIIDPAGCYNYSYKFPGTSNKVYNRWNWPCGYQKDPDADLGSIEVCKKIVTQSCELTDGEGLHSSFSISFPGLDTVIKFSTPLEYSDGLACVVIDELELGTYHFEEEVIDNSNPSVTWYSPLYNSDAPLNFLRSYNNNDPVTLTKDNPDQKLIILNSFKTTPPVTVYYERSEDRSGDGKIDSWYADTTGNGRFDRWEYDIDGDGIPDIFQYDHDDTCYPELTKMIFDEVTKTIGSVAKGDNITNHWYADLNENGYYNRKNYDSNNNGLTNIYTYDRNDDGIFEEVNIDEDYLYIRTHCYESWNQWYLDTNGDGIYDTCRYDQTGNFRFSYDYDLEIVDPAGCYNYSYEFPGTSNKVYNRWNWPCEYQEEPDKGSITVCKKILNGSGDLVKGEDIEAKFSINLPGIGTAKFTTPLQYKDGLSCIVFDDLELGTYAFDQEIITYQDPSISWKEPLYDTDHPHGGLVPYYQTKKIKLSQDSPDKVLLVLNQFKIIEEKVGYTPVKEVGKPSVLWDGSGAEHYDGTSGTINAIDFCSEQECWKVTLLTPISISCQKEGSDPVSYGPLRFMVEWDGRKDMTQEYCVKYSGQYDALDGYCYVENMIEEFYFLETCEHRLVFECMDHSSQFKEIDEQIFKVDEEAFIINLTEKWNLISVPIQLLDNSMDEVFGDHGDVIRSVWSYDGSEWYVYTPDGQPDNNNLHTMVPGNGYLVLSTDQREIVIGGSLFKPGPYVPPQRELSKGWNLIGHYGTLGATIAGDIPYYGGPNLYGDGKAAACALASLDLEKVSSLWTLWGNQNKIITSLEHHYMNPGAGYWMQYNGESMLYAPSTICTI